MALGLLLLDEVDVEEAAGVGFVVAAVLGTSILLLAPPLLEEAMVAVEATLGLTEVAGLSSSLSLMVMTSGILFPT